MPAGCYTESAYNHLPGTRVESPLAKVECAESMSSPGECSMADVRPLPGIRYAEDAKLAELVTPPYDVISPQDQTRFYERHPENIIRLELGREEPGDDDLNNRYSRAAITFAEWRRQGILKQDSPSLYLYQQRFSIGKAVYRRLCL